MAETISGLEGELRSNGISVEELRRGEAVELTYMTAFPGERVHHREMGRALNVFIDLASDGRWEPARVDATVVRTDDDVQGTWYAEADWFRGLAEYRLSEVEFSSLVLDTLEEAADASKDADGTEDVDASETAGAPNADSTEGDE
ncbi:hypothetical protein [Halegenticoccus tardaugens]|uniref:hypothetical protein n=1 Tax=Halegenticoccus tardaugens TaxID=2071624 RepID=UPI00100B1A93|nr:hypothetical protein [Halegenticoccus tardaugens]